MDKTAEQIDRDALLAQCAQPLAKAKWAGSSDVLRPGVEVDILAADPAGRAGLHLGMDAGVPARTACWIRWWGSEYPMFRSCDLADLDLSDEDFDRLAALSARPADGDMVERVAKIIHDEIENDDDSDGGAYRRAARAAYAAITGESHG